jgi:hypothetical protein
VGRQPLATGAGGGGRGWDGRVVLSEGRQAWVKRRKPTDKWAWPNLNFSFISNPPKL